MLTLIRQPTYACDVRVRAHACELADVSVCKGVCMKRDTGCVCFDDQNEEVNDHYTRVIVCFCAL